jgi:hypothetical protein
VESGGERALRSFAVFGRNLGPISLSRHGHIRSTGTPSVTLKGIGDGGTLRDYRYPAGTVHTEHWKIPTTGNYSVEITLPPYNGCFPFTGSMKITSP